jgi:hypothetical protein
MSLGHSGIAFINPISIYFPGISANRGLVAGNLLRATRSCENDG